MALAVTVVVAAVFLAAPAQVVGLFSTDPAVVEAGSAYLRIIAPAQLFMAVHLTLLLVPLAVLLAGPLGLAGVWWAISGTAIARGAAVLVIWARGRWAAQVV